MSLELELLIKSKYSVIDYIRKHDVCELERHGNQLRSSCPVCQGSNQTEFGVTDKMYHCFACSIGGNVIDLVSDLERIPYHDALEKLATELNIDPKDSEQYVRQRSMVETIEKLVESMMPNIVQLDSYLKGRGLTQETIDKFRLGYDTNALIIPIEDIHGKTVAVARRYFEGNVKYRNSKNSEVYDKSTILYNADKAKRMITDKIYVVEGYFDAMSGHQMKLPTVAYCSADVSKEQVALLKHLCVNPNTTIVMCSDNDEAGQKSLNRARETFQTMAPSMVVEVLKYPPGYKDMNDLLKDGVEVATLPTIPIDIYCLRQLLEKHTNRQSQYKVVEKYIKTVTDPMIRADIAVELANEWKDRDVAQIRDWLNVTSEAKSSLSDDFKTVTQGLDSLGEVYRQGVIGLGFPKLDASFGGARKADVVIYAARPGIGKTLLAGETALHLAMRHKLNVLFFSLEMPASALSERLVASFEGISTEALQTIMMGGGKEALHLSAIKDGLEKRIAIIDKSGLTLKDMRKYIEYANAKVFDGRPVDVIIIDYIQYMGGCNDLEGLSATARGLKSLGKDYDILVIALSQISRAGMSWERPRLSQLKGSGDIEQTGDVVLMFWKETDNPSWTLEQQEEKEGTINAGIEKGRRGFVLKGVDLFFDKNTSRVIEK